MEEASFVSICTLITIHVLILHLYKNHDLTFLKITLQHISSVFIVQLQYGKFCARKWSYNDDHNSHGLWLQGFYCIVGEIDFFLKSQTQIFKVYKGKLVVVRENHREIGLSRE